jgi:signal transduction histidine kinase
MKNAFLFVLIVVAVALLLIIGLTGLVAVQRANRINEEIVRINARFHQSERHLEGLRADLDATRIYIRDYMLDPAGESAELARSQFKMLKNSIELRLHDLASLLGPEEAHAIEDLHTEVNGYFDFLISVPVTGPGGFPSGTSGIRRQLRSRREAIDSIASRVAEIDERDFVRGNAEIEKARRSLSTYMWRMTSSGLALGIVITLFSSHRIAVLQRRAYMLQQRRERTEAELRRLSAQLVRAQEEERKSISRELHDEVGQTLTALGIEIGNIERLRRDSGPAFDQHVLEARNLTQQTLRSVRDLAMGLRPSMLDDSGLVPALRWQVREFSKHAGIPVELQIDGPLESLPDSVNTCIYRVVQETLTNCARHAVASNIRVVLHANGDRIFLAVQDDGIGFDRSPNAAGLGIIGMEERVRDLGGDIRITSAPQRGTLLVAEIPIVGRDL